MGKKYVSKALLQTDAYSRIRLILEEARSKAFSVVNFVMVKAYWEIGKVIISEEQKGNERAGYGLGLIKEVAARLTRDYGEGFTETNLKYMRQFYLLFPKSHALRDELSWTHYRMFLKLENPNARGFYMNEAINSRWSTRELERQINSLLFERLALSRDKKKVKAMAKKGQEINNPADMIKDPYVLEFLGLKHEPGLYEKDLETALLGHLQKFLLELGKGFSFIARQQRIKMDEENFYVDLVFYNYMLKCFVLIDLKIGRITHQDLGQMQMYVNYFSREMTKEGDNPAIGIVLCADKSEAVVKYTLPEDNKRIFASRYKLYLPTEKELRNEIIKDKKMIEQYRKQK